MFYCHCAAARGRDPIGCQAMHMKEPRLKTLAIAIFGLCLLEALCFFWSGWTFFLMFRSAGASPSQALAVAEGSYFRGFILLSGGLLHVGEPRARLPLAICGVLVGIYGAALMIKYPNNLGSWNILHGDIIAMGMWSEAIFIGIGLLCLAEIALLVKGAA
jgi:hypothetical protein